MLGSLTINCFYFPAGVQIILAPFSSSNPLIDCLCSTIPNTSQVSLATNPISFFNRK